MAVTASIPFFETSGERREIGRSHGEAFREGIREFVAALRENVEQRSSRSFSRNRLALSLRRLWHASVRYDQGSAEEVRGIAEGSAVNLKDIIFLNSFLDLVNLRDKRTAAGILLGCTSFAVLGEKARNGVLMGQNYEMESFYKKFRLLLRVSPKGGPRQLIYTYMGVLGCAGMNSECLGLCINFLHAKDVSYGVLYPFVVRRILEARGPVWAVGAATIGPRAGGMNFLIGCSGGFVCSVESSSRAHDILYPSNGFLVHTNHYLSDTMKLYDLVIGDKTYNSSITRRGSSVVRLFFAREYLDRRTFVDVVDMIEMLGNHDAYPYSICFHGDAGADELCRGETNASLILDLSRGHMHLASGCPCASGFTSFAV